ncbi:hypothetical protein HID58_070054, partial [Brassica napus]
MRWDPRITNGEWIGGNLDQIKVRTDTGRRFSSHHRCMVMEFRVDISEEIWKIGFVGEQNSISIIFKMKSIAFKVSFWMERRCKGPSNPNSENLQRVNFYGSISSKQWVGVFIFKISSMSICLSLGFMGLEGFVPFKVFFTCLQWNDIVSLALWCCDSSWFLKAYGILLKLSIGMDSVVWEIGQDYWITLDNHSMVSGMRYYGLLGESRKVASWVGAGGVDTQAQSMLRDKIEFRFSFIKMQGRMERDMNCVSLNTFIYLIGWQCWREYSHDGWNV